MNFSDKPVTLEKNQRIGFISRLSNDDQIREINNGLTIASIQSQSETETNENKPTESLKPKLTEAENSEKEKSGIVIRAKAGWFGKGKKVPFLLLLTAQKNSNFCKISITN